MIAENRSAGDIQIIDIKGDISADKSGEFKEIVKKAFEQSNKVIFNFKDVNYICSAGLGVIASYYKEAQSKGIEIKFLHLNSNVKEILDRIRLTSFIQSFDNETDAIKSFS